MCCLLYSKDMSWFHGTSVSSRLDELFGDLPLRLDIAQVAELFGMSTQGVYKWVNTGVVPAYKIGDRWVILRDELRDTLAEGSNVASRTVQKPPNAPASDSE